MTDAVARGARLLAGGELRPSAACGGQFYPPTLLADVGPGMKIWEEEVFGPVSGYPEGFQRWGASTCGRGPGAAYSHLEARCWPSPCVHAPTTSRFPVHAS